MAKGFKSHKNAYLLLGQCGVRQPQTSAHVLHDVPETETSYVRDGIANARGGHGRDSERDAERDVDVVAGDDHDRIVHEAEADEWDPVLQRNVLEVLQRDRRWLRMRYHGCNCSCFVTSDSSVLVLLSTRSHGGRHCTFVVLHVAERLGEIPRSRWSQLITQPLDRVRVLERGLQLPQQHRVLRRARVRAVPSSQHKKARTGARDTWWAASDRGGGDALHGDRVQQSAAHSSVASRD